MECLLKIAITASTNLNKTVVGDIVEGEYRKMQSFFQQEIENGYFD